MNIHYCQCVQVEGNLKYVSSGDRVVIGVNSKDQIYRRVGISRRNPNGNGEFTGMNKV
jgi:hypothetical protein